MKPDRNTSSHTLKQKGMKVQLGILKEDRGYEKIYCLPFDIIFELNFHSNFFSERILLRSDEMSKVTKVLKTFISRN